MKILFLTALLAIITGVTYGYAHAETSKTFAWEIPTTRTDGTALAVTEIAGYRLYNGQSPDNLAFWQAVTIADQSQAVYVINPGDNYVAITTVDTDGNESAYSNVVHVIGLAPPGATVLTITASEITIDQAKIVIQSTNQ